MSGANAPGLVGDLRVWGTRSYGVIGVYIVLAVIILYFVRTSTLDNSSPVLSYALIGVTIFFLVRYLSTQYVLGTSALKAWRLFGSRTIEFATIRKIEFANLRDLGAIGMFASWGYRGRVWSPIIGHFDAVYTDSRGLLVTAGEYPLFLSPEDPERFAQELSRRVRSYTGPLEVDVGSSDARSSGSPRATTAE
ncbi:MAG: PH domain-containing protein [Thermoplasmata archaeon]|nr:PH domain-containing protein [Thermoplasmata archaeon]